MLKALIDRLLLCFGAIFVALNFMCGVFTAGLLADLLTTAPDDPGMGFLLWFLAAVVSIYALFGRDYE